MASKAERDKNKATSGMLDLLYLGMIDDWHRSMIDMQDTLLGLEAVLQPNPDGTFVNRLHKLQRGYTNAVARLIGDGDYWLEWYWLENNMGRKRLGASCGDGKMQPVCNTKDLYELILKSKSRKDDKK